MAEGVGLKARAQDKWKRTHFLRRWSRQRIKARARCGDQANKGRIWRGRTGEVGKEVEFTGAREASPGAWRTPGGLAQVQGACIDCEVLAEQRRAHGRNHAHL